jgi:hypothetical protein
VAADTFLTFDGQRYRLQDTLEADLTDDDFTEVGVATDADIDFEGELLVFRREGDDEAVYTFSPTVEEEAADDGLPGGEATEDLRRHEGEPGPSIAEESPGQATDAGEGPAIVPGSGPVSGDDAAEDPDEGRTIVNPSPDEEPAEEEPADVTVDAVDMADAERRASSGLWLRWEPEP